jgi:hypothetical protein
VDPGREKIGSEIRDDKKFGSGIIKMGEMFDIET